jgi:hypothetical protein
MNTQNYGFMFNNIEIIKASEAVTENTSLTLHILCLEENVDEVKQVEVFRINSLVGATCQLRGGSRRSL